MNDLAAPARAGGALKHELYRELNDSRIAGARDRPEGRGPQHGSRRSERGRIEQVEYLCAKLDRLAGAQA